MAVFLSSSIFFFFLVFFCKDCFRRGLWMTFISFFFHVQHFCQVREFVSFASTNFCPAHCHLWDLSAGLMFGLFPLISICQTCFTCFCSFMRSRCSACSSIQSTSGSVQISLFIFIYLVVLSLWSTASFSSL